MADDCRLSVEELPALTGCAVDWSAGWFAKLWSLARAPLKLPNIDYLPLGKIKLLERLGEVNAGKFAFRFGSKVPPGWRQNWRHVCFTLQIGDPQV